LRKIKNKTKAKENNNNNNKKEKTNFKVIVAEAAVFVAGTGGAPADWRAIWVEGQSPWCACAREWVA
jgi:hypothetical protein